MASINDIINMDDVNEEYGNYIGITKELQNITFVSKQHRKKLFDLIQHLLQERIMYRYEINKPPYHAYNDIKEEEYDMISNFFKQTKDYMKNKNKYSEIYNNLDKIEKFFIYLIQNRRKKFDYLYIDTNDSKITIEDNVVKYRDIRIPLDNRLTFILESTNNEIFVRMILRYLGYGITGHHCAIPYNTYKYLYDVFKIRGEGFSSPLNSKLLTMKNTVFCTLFEDTDKYIGSKGPFSTKTIIENSDKNFTVNPPYIESIMYYAYEQVIEAFENIQREDFLIIFLIPKWTDSQTYISLKNYKYLVKLVEPPEDGHYMNCNGHIVHMSGVVNAMFFLSRNKTIVTNENIKELYKIWNTYEEDKDNQSKFQKRIQII